MDESYCCNGCLKYTVLYASKVVAKSNEGIGEGKMRALIIEDDKPLSDTLCRMLGSIAETDAAYDGESGLEKILTQEYDIVILDIMLPKMNGDEVLRNVRKHKLTPIIILSAIGMLERKVEFLNMGADDYTVTYKDKVLPVSGKMYEVLETLVKNKEITVTKQQLFDSVCGFYSETIQTVIEVYVYRLRKILADIGMSECLQTIKTVGYRWREGLIAEKVHGRGCYE